MLQASELVLIFIDHSSYLYAAMHTTHFTGPLIKFGVEPAWRNMGEGQRKGSEVQGFLLLLIRGTDEGGLTYKDSCFC